jgi:hypothetical protein
MRSRPSRPVHRGAGCGAASALLLGATLFLAAAPAPADTIVLDGDHVTDWVRVMDSSAWKYRDACLRPEALLKFDLDWHWPVSGIVAAHLELFVERAAPGDSVLVWHVDRDTWSYGLGDPDTLRLWPVWHLIGAYAVADSGPLSVDVTSHLQEELVASDRTFSLKITSRGSYRDVRIASPLTLGQRMRPRIVAQVTSPLGVVAPPDLAVSTADLRLSPARPFPGQPVAVQAWVRNLGPQPPLPVAIPVSFWDGEPGTGQFIGSSVLSGVPPTDGASLVTVTWVAARGLHDLHVVVDSAGTVAELDETNNAAFREFEIADPGAVTGVLEDVESFEAPGLRQWHTDFEVPRQYAAFGTKCFYLSRSGAEAYHGDYAMEMFLDGTGDDGTIWLERALAVNPNSLVDVDLDFELFRYYPDIAYFAVASVGVLDPEGETDFVRLDGPREGWVLHSYHQRVYSGSCDRVHVAVGLTVSWETAGTLFLDLIRVRATYLPSGGVEPAAPSAPALELLQNRPNPMGALATIAYRLGRDGPVSLRIYDAAGRLVTTLHDGPQRAGWHEVRWNGTNAAGQALPAGVYFYRLDRAGTSESRKLLLVR